MKAKAKKKCPFFIPGKAALTDIQRSLYGDDAGWCDEIDGPCQKDYLCPSAKIINTLTEALEAIAAISAPEGDIIGQPCKACKKRIRLAKKALRTPPRKKRPPLKKRVASSVNKALTDGMAYFAKNAMKIREYQERRKRMQQERQQMEGQADGKN